MNQILKVYYSKKLKLFFTIQFFLSMILTFFAMMNLLKMLQAKEIEKRISETISLHAKLHAIFAESEVEDSLYFGRILCSKIELDEYIFNQYSPENLKILPCKFSGKSLEETGNICIIGHNYFNHRFFSDLNQLEIGDEVIVKDWKEQSYFYQVYKKYEIEEKDVEQVTKAETTREITLCTCTWDKQKRLIIRAKFICKKI